MNYIIDIPLSFLKMVWELYWGLALGFMLSSLIRAFIPSETISQAIGKTNIRSVGIATFFGAISSSCSYAAASMAKTLFSKGSSMPNAFAFMIASTNLVFEIFIIIVTLLGTSFFIGELIGGLFFILVTCLLAVYFFPKKIIEDARKHIEESENKTDDIPMMDGMMSEEMETDTKKTTFSDKIKEASAYFTMDVDMVGKDILIGVTIASVFMVLIPQSFWHFLFLSEASELPHFIILFWNAFIGTLIAILSFVCSVGNVVLAAVLWYGGISFGGVIAFMLSDLITIPLLQVYKTYYGKKTMWTIFLFFFVGIIATALFLDYSFAALDWLPEAPKGDMKMTADHIGWNYQTILNLIFIPLSIGYYFMGRKNGGSMMMM